MSVIEISQSDSTGDPNRPSRIRLARYVCGVMQRGAVARMMTLVARDNKYAGRFPYWSARGCHMMHPQP